MRLTIDFLLTLLIELPIIAFFFKKKYREQAVLTAFLINLVTWPLVQVVLFSTDLNPQNPILAICIILAEASAYKIWLDCTWKKSFLMSVIANLISFIMSQALIAIFHHL
jgi:hypothetical protein